MNKPRQPMLTKPVMVRLDVEMYDALVAESEANERTVAQTLRFAAKQYLDSRGSDPVTEG